jgi:hypothetical protein
MPSRPSHSQSVSENSNNLEEIKALLCALNDALGKEFIVIGGWAVWAYEQDEMSLDGDAMISTSALSILRDKYVVTNTPQKRQRQFATPEGFDVDLYIEHQHGLRVPFDELQAYSRHIQRMHVASPEHLLVLKLEAAKDREGSAKGEKDKRDVLRIVQAIGRDSNRHSVILGRYLSDEDWKRIEKIIANVPVTEQVSGGNAFNAKALRKRLAEIVEDIKDESERSIKSNEDH